MDITHPTPTPTPPRIVRTTPPAPARPGPREPTAPSQATHPAQARKHAAAAPPRPPPRPTPPTTRRRRKTRPRKVRLGLYSPDLFKTKWGKWRKHPTGTFEELITNYHKAFAHIERETRQLARRRFLDSHGPAAALWQFVHREGRFPMPSNRALTYADHRREYYRLRALGQSHHAAATRSGHWPHRAGDNGRSRYE